MITFIVAKIEGEKNGAVLKVTHNYSNVNDLLAAIRTAVNDWLWNTEKGDQAWQEASEDFNWGDLTLHLNVPIPGVTGIEHIDDGFAENMVFVNHDEVLRED